MRLREPAAWVALAALALNLALAVVGLATFEGPLVNLGWMWSERVANPTSLLTLAILVSFCVLHERTRYARQLTLFSIIVGLIAVAFGLTLALLGIAASAPILAVLVAIVPQVISIIAVGLLIKLWQLQAVPRRLPPGIGLVLPEQVGGRPDQDLTDPSPSSPAPSEPDQRLQPTWHTDGAPGAAWRPAVDAGAGVGPTVDWGETPTVRWNAIPTSNNGSRPETRPGDSVVHPTVPMPEQDELSGLGDPSPGQEQWNSQPLALDWSGSTRS
jgi:hypothetical protein